MIRPGVRLALDLGSSRVGVARSDASGTLASPFAVWPAEGWIEQLAAAVQDWEPIEVLVGLPVNLTGIEALAAEQVRAELALVGERLPALRLRLVDERLTTAAARRQLRDAGFTTRTDRGLIDAAAATVLLQDALDAERLRGEPPGEVWQ